MGSIRKQISIFSGASGIRYQVVSTTKEAYQWIVANLTPEQQACVRTQETYVKVAPLPHTARTV